MESGEWKRECRMLSKELNMDYEEKSKQNAVWGIEYGKWNVKYGR